MAKLDGLRWIPMMIQAYQEARMRLNSDHPIINEPISQVNTNLHPMVPQIHRHRNQKAKKSMEINNIQSRPKKQSTPVQVTSTSRLIRELRAANKKLNRLESISQQLKTMEGMFAGLREEIQQTASEIQSDTEKGPSI